MPNAVMSESFIDLPGAADCIDGTEFSLSAYRIIYGEPPLLQVSALNVDCSDEGPIRADMETAKIPCNVSGLHSSADPSSSKLRSCNTSGDRSVSGDLSHESSRTHSALEPASMFNGSSESGRGLVSADRRTGQAFNHDVFPEPIHVSRCNISTGMYSMVAEDKIFESLHDRRTSQHPCASPELMHRSVLSRADIANSSIGSTRMRSCLLIEKNRLSSAEYTKHTGQSSSTDERIKGVSAGVKPSAERTMEYSQTAQEPWPSNSSYMNESCISFADVLSSTPLREYGDPRNYQPLDLSVSGIEESPLDCSFRKESDEPLNLAVSVSQGLPLQTPSQKCALNFCMEKRAFSSSSSKNIEAINPPIVGKRLKGMSSVDFGEPLTTESRRKVPFSQIDSNSSKLLSVEPLTKCDVLENLNDKENRNIEFTSVEGSLQCDDDEDDDDFVPDGDATLLNDFSIFEYYEPYHNETIVDEDQLQNTGTDKEKFDEMGFADLDQNDSDANINVKKNMANRRLKEQGLEYIRKNGTKASARKVRQACNCLKRKCNEKFSDELRGKFLSHLLKLKFSGQDQFLSSHVSVTYVARHRVVNSRRVFTYNYHLPGVGGQIRVCLKMFLNTFDVTEKKMRVLVSKKIAGMGICADDKRLLNTNRCPITAETKAYIEEHIRSFPAYYSHYTREKSGKKYLSSDLNISKMYDLYVTKCVKDAQQPVHYNTYRILFNGFNLGFRKPKADTCGECDRLRVIIKQASDGPDKVQAEQILCAHQTIAKFVYDQKKKEVTAAKTDSTIRTLSFDLQKCLATPYLRNGLAFYKRQLYTYNLTIFETFQNRNKGICYIWDESRGRRGANEIGSCLFADFNEFIAKNPDTHIINMYSDRCGGQNLNFIICMMFSYITEQNFHSGRDVTLRHNFMVSGHSHMEVDTVHGAIERAKKATSVDIDTPRDWAIFISQIKRKVPLEVVDLAQHQLLSMKSLSCRYKKPRLNSDGQTIKFNAVAMFEYRSSCPGTIFYKTDLASDHYCEFDICDSDTLRQPLPNLNPLETEPIPLPHEKLQDLKKLMPFVSNKTYYEAMLKTLVVPKRGRKAKSEVKDDNFDDDLDIDIEHL